MGRSQLRISSACVFDVLQFGEGQTSPQAIAHYQQEDLVSLGRMILALACGWRAASASHPSSPPLPRPPLLPRNPRKRTVDEEAVNIFRGGRGVQPDGAHTPRVELAYDNARHW